MAISYLEQEANAERAQEIVRNGYSVDGEYSESHPDALSDGDPLGKGTAQPQKGPTRPHQNPSKTTYDYAIDTSSTTGPAGQGGGGSYDIDGKDGIGGRKREVAYNLYSEGNEYPGGLKLDETIPGQYFVK